MGVDLSFQSEELAALICILEFLTFRKGVFPVLPVGHTLIDKGDHCTHDTTIEDRPPLHIGPGDATQSDHICKYVESPIYRTDIHQIEKRQHEPDPLKQVSRRRIAVFDHHRKGAEYTINQEKVYTTGGKTLEKTRKGAKDAGAENQQVHKQDVGHHDPYKNHRFLTAVALYRHQAKVTISHNRWFAGQMNWPNDG